VCRAFTPTPPAAQSADPTPVLAPAGFDPAGYGWTLVAEGFNQPVLITHAGDGSGRLFVVEQTGAIFVLDADGQALPEPMLDISPLVSNGYEQGLLGLAFPPGFPAEQPHFYVNYTDVNGDTNVVRYSLSEDPNVADPDSAAQILFVEQPYPNHNGGHLAFGPDGYLYIGLGDGGSGGDPQGRAQNLNELLGKMLRLDVLGGEPYAIPPDNPFLAGPAAREIWAYGLRNPWRYSFDRAAGDLYIADVGQNAYEEVNFQPAGSAGGENYGWDYLEGLHPFEGEPPPGLIAPVAEYAQAEGGCSVTGGYVYRGQQMPELSGIYFFGDYCSGLIWALFRNAAGEWQQQLAFETGFSISSFGEDEAGELYVVDHGGGVHRLAPQ
jgi:glucose/arabinose dehydrogenase